MCPTRYWSGLKDVETLVVFGASYTQTIGPGESLVQPTIDEPLGVPFPGSTYTEEGLPNWGGHLAKWNTERPLLVWNYAKGGSTVGEVQAQVQDFLSNIPERFTTPAYSQNATDAHAERFRRALFACFVGINDVCFDIDPPERVQRLFDICIAPLHEAGARNFLLFDNPPRMRASGSRCLSPAYEQHHTKIKAWNETLWRLSEKVETDHAETSIFVFPTWELFTYIFDNPERHGFSSEDVNRGYGGKMWMDGLHPTSAIHEIIAQHVVELLS